MQPGPFGVSEVGPAQMLVDRELISGASHSFKVGDGFGNRQPQLALIE